MKTTPALLLLLAGLMACGSSFAGTVYRCELDGGRSYVSKPVAGGQCSAVSHYVVRRASYAAPVAQRSVPAPASLSTPVSDFIPTAPAVSAPQSYQAPRLVQGQVYSYMDDGVRHYSSRRPQGVANASAIRTIRYSYMETCFACGAKPGVNFGSIRLKPDAYRDEIASAASQYGVAESVVRAIIHAESAFNPNAMSRVGAQGLMQLMPATARRFGVDNAFDPAQNIRGGVQYLAFLLKRFKGNVALAAAGYNAGEGAVDKYNGVPPYSETQRYVQRVSLLNDRYGSSTVLR